MKKIHKKKSVLPFLILTVLLVSVSVLIYRVLKIRQVDCYSQFGPCPEEINQGLNHYVGTPLLKPLSGDVIKNDLKSFSQIKSASLYRRLPSTLVVALSLRRPIGAIGSNVLGAQVIVDEEGFVFQKIPQSALPTLITQDLPPVPSQLSAGQLRSLLSLELVANLFDTQVSGILDKETLTITTPNDLKVIVDIAQPTSNWYTPLQLIIHRSKINAKMPHKIDLRFTNSVITY
jgi:cell division septal protein FtsQ